MKEYQFVRCLFCNTGKETYVTRAIQANGWGKAIFPRRTKTVMKNGARVDVHVPLMPGYVFVYDDQDTPRIRESLRLLHVIRVLTYSDGTEVLRGNDLAFAQWLWQLDGHVDVLKAVQEGDRVEIVDGVFKQLRGTITRMDKRRKTIRVALDTEGTPKQIWLAYEIVEKLDGEVQS